MQKIILAVLALLSFSAFADVDAYFFKDASEIKWGQSLQQVQTVYPGGTIWPNTDGRDGEFVYAVAGDFRVLGIDLSVPLIHFVFTPKGQLQRVFFHFRFSERDAALYAVAQVLGQDYTIKDIGTERQFIWKPGRASFAEFEMGNSVQYPWAFLAVRSLVNEDKRR